MATPRRLLKNFKPAGKPDLLSVLERRGRSAEAYLADNNVKTFKELKALLKNDLAEYDISEKFIDLAEAYVESLKELALLPPPQEEEEEDLSSENEDSDDTDLAVVETPENAGGRKRKTIIVSKSKGTIKGEQG